MSKLSLDALRMRAESIVSEDLMASISGGTANACHPASTTQQPTHTTVIDNTRVVIPTLPKVPPQKQ